MQRFERQKNVDVVRLLEQHGKGDQIFLRGVFRHVKIVWNRAG